MTTVNVLSVGGAVPIIEKGLIEHFTVHRLDDFSQLKLFLQEIGPQIRGVASGAGHVKIDGAFFSLMPNLEIVSSFGVGYDHVDAGEGCKRKVVVTNTPDVLTGEVADLALGLLLATVRRLPQADRYLRAGLWPKAAFPLTHTLRNRKVGILGLGRIGKVVARRLEAFDLEVAYHGRNAQHDVGYAYYPKLVDLAKAVDVLIVIASGGAETRHMVNADVLKALGPEGILINVGRGSVVDESALIDALKSGAIHSAGLDVFEHEPHVPAELIALDQVVLLPHVGSASVHTRNAMGQLVVDNLASWFKGTGPVTPVPESRPLL